MSCPRPDTERSNPKDVGELAEPLRSRIAQAIADAPGKGLVLVSGFRDPGRQWDLRHQRCPGRECDKRCKGYPVTAVPYASKHQTREAADMGGRALDWLIANRERYGLALTVSSENWHFEADRRDVRTGRVHNRPTVPIAPYGQAGKPQPNPNPAPQPPPPEPETFMAALTDQEQKELLAAARSANKNALLALEQANKAREAADAARLLGLEQQRRMARVIDHLGIEA